jgi:hypothetical protein
MRPFPKHLLLALISATFFSTAAQANSPVNDRVFITGDSAKQLYDAMKSDGSIIRTRGGNPARSLLNGKLVCSAVLRGAVPSGDWRCSIAKKLEPFEIHHIYRHLNVKPITTNAFHRNVKIVGDIIFMSSHNEDQETLNTAMPNKLDNKIFYKHPCLNVTTLTAAKKCMKFWAKEIYQEYNLTNDSLVVKTNDESLAQLRNALAIDNYNDQAISETLEVAKQSKFMAVFGEYQDEMHLLYFTLTKDSVMAPIEMNDMNTVDIDWSAAKGMFPPPRLSSPSAVKKFYAQQITCALLLGQNPPASVGFESIKELVKDELDNL